MPHVVLEGTPAIDELADGFEPVFEKDGDRIVKTQALWRGVDEEALLAEGLTIDGGPPQPVLVRVDRRADGLVVRLHEISDGVEKTGLVKRLLALVAHQLMSIDGGLSVGETNLQDYLEA